MQITWSIPDLKYGCRDLKVEKGGNPLDHVKVDSTLQSLKQSLVSLNH